MSGELPCSVLSTYLSIIHIKKKTKKIRELISYYYFYRTLYRFRGPQPRRPTDPHKSGIFRTLAVLRVQTGHGSVADLLRRHVHHATATRTHLRRTYNIDCLLYYTNSRVKLYINILFVIPITPSVHLVREKYIYHWEDIVE